MTVIDTSVMIPFLNGSPEAVNKVSQASKMNGQIVITIITAYEMLKGASLSSKPEQNLKKVKDVLSSVQVLDLTPAACEEASQIFCDLKKAGTLIGEFDILIAAIAKINGEALLTQDKHFKFISGLKLIER